MEVGHSFRSKWGVIPTEVGQHSEIDGAPFRESGAARPVAPPSMSEHFRRRCLGGISIPSRYGVRHL
jgi:hypothetical protein